MRQNTELDQYIAEQIKDYLENNNSKDRKLLCEGITNICSAAYPEEKNIFHSLSERILRAAQDPQQLNFKDKLKKIIETKAPITNPKVSNIIGAFANKERNIESYSLSK